MRKIRTTLNLKTGDNDPKIPVLPFSRAHYFEFDGTTSRRVDPHSTTGLNSVYRADNTTFEIVDVVDRTPMAVWDRTLSSVGNTYPVAGYRRNRLGQRPKNVF
ncbi:MAG: hypothetical protein H9W81_07735 [Enterococcus sp.]|nr:hypothetical protein [Enterococcus sp.]